MRRTLHVAALLTAAGAAYFAWTADIRAQGPHEESGAEGREREHQRGVLVAAREKRDGNGGGIVGEYLEIVHFQGVTGCDADHSPDLRGANLSRNQARLSGHRA